MSDIISRHEAIDLLLEHGMVTAAIYLDRVPPAKPTLYGYNIETLVIIARIMQKENVTPEKAIECFEDLEKMTQMIIEEFKEITENAYKNL